MLGAGRWLLTGAVDHWPPGPLAHWPLAAGCWLLTADCWLLVLGFWLIRAFFPPPPLPSLLFPSLLPSPLYPLPSPLSPPLSPLPPFLHHPCPPICLILCPVASFFKPAQPASFPPSFPVPPSPFDHNRRPWLPVRLNGLCDITCIILLPTVVARHIDHTMEFSWSLLF